MTQPQISVIRWESNTESCRPGWPCTRVLLAFDWCSWYFISHSMNFRAWAVSPTSTNYLAAYHFWWQIVPIKEGSWYRPILGKCAHSLVGVGSDDYPGLLEVARSTWPPNWDPLSVCAENGSCFWSVPCFLGRGTYCFPCSHNSNVGASPWSPSRIQTASMGENWCKITTFFLPSWTSQ